MDWIEARRSTIDLWRGIREAVGSAEELQLLTDINGVCALCDKAREHSGPHEGPCTYCLAYRQFGGCLEASRELSDLVVQRRWDEVRQHVDDFIARLEAIEAPAPGSSTVTP